MKLIDISPNDLTTVKNILDKYVPEYEIRAFGSRVTWTAKESSDLDLVVMTDKPLATMRMADLKEAFSESDLPFKVDVVDWAATKEGFKEIIEKQAVLLRDHISSEQNPLYAPVFPSDWKPYSLYELAEWVNGMAFRNISFSNIGKPVIKIAEIKDGITGQTKFTEEEYDKVYLLTEGDMLFSWSGQPETSIDTFWYHGPAGWLNQHIFKVLPKNDCEYGFFYYLLKYLKPNFIRIASNKQTTGLGHVTKKDLQNIKVRIPNKNLQRAIAHILGALDDKIELNRKMNQTLEEIARSIYKSWFVDFDPVKKKEAGEPTGLPEEIDKLFPSEFEESELGMIPKGWREVSASDLFQISPSVSLKKGELARCAEMSNLPTSGFLVTKTSTKPYNGGAKFLRNDVLLARITPCLENGKTAIAHFLAPKEIGFGSTEFIVLRGKANVSYHFVYCLARDANFRAHCIASMVGSSGRQRVQNACFDNYRTAISATDLFLPFSKVVEPLFQDIITGGSEAEVLSNIRDTLLPLLLSGKLQIKDAEKLLEKAGL
jgi:type I restriction enzyme S subunit